MTRPITTIGFDADDTLWQNERFFRLTESASSLCSVPMALPPKSPGGCSRPSAATSPSTVRHQGLRALDDRDRDRDHRRHRAGFRHRRDPRRRREMAAHPVETLPQARETLERLASTHRLVLITKGDLFDQERKLAQSGLGELFHGVEIVSDKTPEVYRRIFERHGDGPQRAMMVGKLAEIGRSAGAGRRRLGRPHPARADLGAGACRGTGRRAALSPPRPAVGARRTGRADRGGGGGRIGRRRRPYPRHSAISLRMKASPAANCST